MEISAILGELSGSLEWMVLFRLSTFRTLAPNDQAVRDMYFLPAELDLDPFSHVVLTSAGRLLAPKDASQPLVDGVTLAPHRLPAGAETLSQRYADKLRLFPVDRADCVGLGTAPGYAPVLLHVELEDGKARAQAVLSEMPTRRHFELLQAVGVTFEGAERAKDYVVARFTNRIPQHIHAAMLANFARTDNCNIFFLQHCNIDPILESGLLKSSENRLRWARDHVFAALDRLAEQAMGRQLCMTCQPPPPRDPVPFGDVVPLGFVHAAMNRNPASTQRVALRKLLEERRVRGLWSFHSGDLDTSTDSALVLQGLDDRAAVEALERFSDGKGAYYPQLWSKSPEPGKMEWDDTKRHWCQADYATTCFVHALRKRVGLPRKPETDRFIRAGFATRSGLYFANPYMVDWIVAQAIAGDEDKADLRQQLLDELRGSVNDDYSFGGWDRPLSTAWAILALEALGYHGRMVRAAQLYLLRNLQPDGTVAPSMPFYSSQFTTGERGPQKVVVGGQLLDVYRYEDTYSLIGTAVAAAALSVERAANDPDPEVFQTLQRNAHPRYRHTDLVAYVEAVALQPYLA